LWEVELVAVAVTGAVVEEVVLVDIGQDQGQQSQRELLTL
jgi:hypothetical protein